MDPLDLQEFFGENFNFTETEPYSEKFEEFGIENMNFYSNSGSLFALMLIIFVYAFFKKIVSCCSIKFAKYKTMRKLGIWSYSENSFLDFRISITRL